MVAVLEVTHSLYTEEKMKKKDVIDWKVNSVWKIYPDPKADVLFPRWWHKLMFWKKWNYGEWKMRREYKSLKEIMNSL